MPYAPQPRIENPNLRVPISFVVDDPAPCINALWYFHHQVRKEPRPDHKRAIPVEFMQRWCRFAKDSEIRGDFTILPYPAGLGRIDDHLEGYDDGELRSWLDLARSVIVPQFDIHCEILTHTLALDLKTHKLLDISEHDWTERQDEATLTEYFAAAMQILKDTGVPNHGLTQPVVYWGDEAMYARAILAAEKRVNNRCVTHNFVHWDSQSPFVPPRITHLDERAGEAVVSVWTGCVDPIWDVQISGKPAQTTSPDTLADRFITADGKGGRLAELLAGGGPIVFVTHWQTLFSNGTELGLATYKEVVARINSLWGPQVAWRKLSDMSRHFLAASMAKCNSSATREMCTVEVSCPFATDVITVSIPTPWQLTKQPTVTLDGRSLSQVTDPLMLDVDKWLMRGAIITVSLALDRNISRTICIKP